MLSGPLTASPSTRRRRTRPGPVELAAVELSEKLRLGTFGRIYFAAGVVLCVLILYVSLAAQVTQSSYEISRLKAQQADLLAQQEQLRYQEANLQAPGQVQRDASRAGMQRGAATRYVQYQPVALDLSTHAGAAAPDRTPLWQRALAAILNGVGGTKDVLASG
jgi:hypothetical protein